MPAIRNCFVPRKGMDIFTIDYAGLELAVCANQLYLATGMHNMLDLINSGDKPKDPHSVFAAKLKGIKDKRIITYEEFMANKNHPDYKPFRSYAKPINLGFPGGIGYDVMRGLLAKQGIFPKFKVLKVVKLDGKWITPEAAKMAEESLVHLRNKYFKEGYPVRIRRALVNEWHLVYDELVFTKQQMFDLYPDLQLFLRRKHIDFIMQNETKKTKNDFGEEEVEEVYKYMIGTNVFAYRTYTQLCNGYLMQSPAAEGAKKAVIAIMEKYMDDPRINILAFIHDEVVGEVTQEDVKEEIVRDICNILIKEMQTIVPYARITVEWGIKKVWDKEGEYMGGQIWQDPLRKIS